MPKYDLSQSWSAPIPVQAGDIIQSPGRHMILIGATTPAADGDAVELPPGKGVTITGATAISSRCASRHGGSLKVIRGL